MSCTPRPVKLPQNGYQVCLRKLLVPVVLPWISVAPLRKMATTCRDISKLSSLRAASRPAVQGIKRFETERRPSRSIFFRGPWDGTRGTMNYYSLALRARRIKANRREENRVGDGWARLQVGKIMATAVLLIKKPAANANYVNTGKKLAIICLSLLYVLPFKYLQKLYRRDDFLSGATNISPISETRKDGSRSKFRLETRAADSRRHGIYRTPSSRDHNGPRLKYGKQVSRLNGWVSLNYSTNYSTNCLTNRAVVFNIVNVQARQDKRELGLSRCPGRIPRTDTGDYSRVTQVTGYQRNSGLG